MRVGVAAGAGAGASAGIGAGAGEADDAGAGGWLDTSAGADLDAGASVCGVLGCTYTSLEATKMKRHKLTHTGEKFYTCPEPGCGYSTTETSHLKRHMCKHTGEKCVSLRCAVQEARARRTHLALSYPFCSLRDPPPPTHTHTHASRPYKCPEELCPYPGAIEAVTLRRHVLTMHGYEMAKTQRGSKASRAAVNAPAATEAVEAAKLTAKIVPQGSPGEWQSATVPSSSPLTSFLRVPTPKLTRPPVPNLSAESGLLPWE